MARETGAAAAGAAEELGAAATEARVAGWAWAQRAEETGTEAATGVGSEEEEEATARRTTSRSCFRPLEAAATLRILL